MTDYILITDEKPKRKKKSSTASGKRAKPRPKTGEFITIVDSRPSSGQGSLKKRLKDKSSKGGNGRENSKVIVPPVAANGKPSVIAEASVENPPGSNSSGDIEYGDTLEKCSTVEEVREWLIRQQQDFNDKVARAFNWRKMSDETRCKADDILYGVGTNSAFVLIDDRLCIEAFEKLRNLLASYLSASGANEAALITFIMADGGTSMDRPVIEVRKSRKHVNDIMRKIAPHWVGMIDLAFFWTIRHEDGGLHAQRHEHVVAWGRDFIAEAKRIAEAQSKKLPANVTDLPVIKVVPAWDCSEVNLARLVAYLLKAPARGKNWFQYPDGRDVMNHTEKKDRYIQFLRLAQLRSLLTLEDVILGGGDGIKVKGSMTRDMRGLAQAAARDRSSIHPDLTATFWSVFNQELGQTHWGVPAIVRR